MAQAADAIAANPHLERLHEMRTFGGAIQTPGIEDRVLTTLLRRDGELKEAIADAHATFSALKDAEPDFLTLDEAEQVAKTQAGIVNFYAIDAVNPYVAAGAKGPWVVTLKGAVVYDCGGYGMLGLGHAPDAVLATMNQPHVMANIMTPNVSQRAFVDALEREIGHTRAGGTPFTHYLCLNSGSESVSLATRLADVNAKVMTDPGGQHAGRPVRGLTLRGSFHGRTDRPARLSDSSIGTYRKHLRSFADKEYLLTVEPNNLAELEAVFARADEEAFFIEVMFMEPVMGEGNPGQAISPEFYARVRELTAQHGSLLLVDSIQAGLRAHGVLSVVDYPGFSDLPPPDMETYSKALNAGQYPLSVLALNERTASLYRTGIYGNTMTSNPRALDIAVTVLKQFTPALRQNVRERGAEFVHKLEKLADELGGNVITKVQGTGLLLSCELSEAYKCYGANSIEEYLRKHGLGVIHGGVRSLRFTPSLRMTSEEIDLVVDLVRAGLQHGPRLT